MTLAVSRIARRIIAAGAIFQATCTKLPQRTICKTILSHLPRHTQANAGRRVAFLHPTGTNFHAVRTVAAILARLVTVGTTETRRAISQTASSRRIANGILGAVALVLAVAAPTSLGTRHLAPISHESGPTLALPSLGIAAIRVLGEAAALVSAIWPKGVPGARQIAAGTEQARIAFAEAEYPVAAAAAGAHLRTQLVAAFPKQTGWTPVLAEVTLDPRRTLAPSGDMVAFPAIQTLAYFIATFTKKTL